jgi:tRNA modification GTPase
MSSTSGPTIDTIAALATPAGTAALAVVRLSGGGCARLAASIFGSPPPPRVACHRHYRTLDGVALDDVVTIYFPGPGSYTGEDSLEISPHGNPLIVERMLADLVARGCRLAEPGEFTRRAFFNGRLDLAQAEAVIDVIHAQSERALAVAQRQLQGALGKHLNALSDELLQALARIEAYIDFPEEDLPAEDRTEVESRLHNVLRGTQALLATRAYGEQLREGIRTVILGAPNAGKSSLLNRLLGRDRALVSAQPGTTRDYLEERIQLGPHSLRIVDTAGLNPAPAELERQGIAHTLSWAAEADLVLLVIDATAPSPALPPAVTARLTAANTVVVFNKVDLLAPGFEAVADAPTGLAVVRLSTVTGAGLADLATEVTRLADGFRPDRDAEGLVVNARHADALTRAAGGLERALAHLTDAGPTELLASDLRRTLEALGEIAGKFDNEAMLDRLFATFCIGK